MNIVRKGDLNNQGGKVSVTKNLKVFSNGKLVSTKGDKVIYTSSKPPTKTGNGSTSVFINEISVNRVGDIDLDGSIRIKGDQKVKAG